MARKVFSLTVAWIMILTLITPMTFAASYGWVKTSGYVRLRSGPGNYSVVESVRDGAKLELYGTTGDWYHVRVINTGDIGYIYKSYVSTSNATSDESASLGFSGKVCTIKARTTALRKSASNSAGSVGKLKKGTKLVITAARGDFYKVKVLSSGKTGYVLKSSVKMGISAKTNGRVYLRSAASENAHSIKTLQEGVSIVVYSVGSNWSKVRRGSDNGYINNAYIKI